MGVARYRTYACSLNLLPRREFDKINLSALQGDHQVVATATRGLVAFRSGRVDEGRASYLQAIEMAGQYEQRLRAMATIYYAREEMLASTTEAIKAMELANDVSKGIKDAVFREVFQRELGSKNEKVSSVPR